MTSTDRECRLYLITPPAIDDLNIFASDFEAALDGGDVACVQLRLKAADGGAPSEEAVRAAGERLAPLAQARDIAFVVNDSPDLARALGADGVHIGQGDGSYEAARACVGPDAIVGVTCHASRHLAMEAGEAGADYVAFGAFYPTATKTADIRAEPEILAWWSEIFTIPCVAIGGIDARNCAPLVTAGADFLAVSGAIWRHADGPRAAVSELNAAIDAALPGD